MIREQNYNLVLVGSGKYTNVYCMEIDTLHKVAVKVLKPAYEKNKFFQEQLIKEAQLTQRVTHPAVRKVFEIVRNEEDGTYQVMMEYIDGYNMEQYIQNFGSIPEKQVVQWLTKLIPALAEANRQGIIHGMVSPANLLITPRGELKIAEFKGDLFESELFPEDADAENILYLSPEQIQHMGSITGRSDIYSLGATMYSLLTGKDPYKVQGNGVDEVRIKILNDPIPFIDKCSVMINELIQTATAKNPGDRFASFESMLTALTGEQPFVREASPLQASLFDQVAEEKNTPPAVIPEETTHEVDEGLTVPEVVPDDTEIKRSADELIVVNDPATGPETAAPFDPEEEKVKTKQDHTRVNIPLIPDTEKVDEDAPVDKEDLDARAKKIWERIAAVRNEDTEPVVSTVNVLTTSNIDARNLGEHKPKIAARENKMTPVQPVIPEENPHEPVDNAKKEEAVTEIIVPDEAVASHVTDDLKPTVVETKEAEKPAPSLSKLPSEATIEPLAPVNSPRPKATQTRQKPARRENQETKKEIPSSQTPLQPVQKKVTPAVQPEVAKSQPEKTPAATQPQAQPFVVQPAVVNVPDKRKKAIWPWFLVLGLLLGGGFYWWQNNMLAEPEIIQTAVPVPVTDTAVTQTRDTTPMAVAADIPVNVDSIAEADTGSLSLVDLENAKNEKKMQLLAAAKAREEELKKLAAQKETKAIDKSKIEILGAYQNGVAPFRLNGAIGFVRTDGDIVVQPRYNEILGFSNGLAPVQLKGKWGFVNVNGKEIITPAYEEIFGFSRGLAGVKKNGKWGFINATGKVVTPLKYDLVTDYSEGLAGVRRDGKWGFVNISGAEVVKCEYSNAWSYTGGLAGVEKGGLWGFINKSGNVQVPLRYNQVNNFSNGLACVERNNKFGFIDKNGREVIDMFYDAAKPFNGSTARVFKNGKWFFINKEGKCVRDCN